MPRFLLEYTDEFPNGRVLQLPGDVAIEDWPYLQFETLPTITSVDNAVGTPITADDGTLSDTATMVGQWEADGVLIADPDASFTPDVTYIGKKVRRRVAVEGWTLVAYSNEITVTTLPTDVSFPFPIVLENSVYRPTSQTTWFTPVVKFTGMSGGEIEWTTTSTDPVPESQVEVVTQTGPVGEYQIFMRDPAKNNPGASPRVDYSVFQASEVTRRASLKFRWRATVGSGTWSAWSSVVAVAEPSTAPPPEVTAEWFPASSRLKEAYEAGIVGSQGQQYQRCRTWNLGVIDPTKRGWVITQQDENGCRLAKNANAGTDGNPVVWGFPRLDGYHGGKSGGLYLNTDDNEGAGLFIGVTGYYEGGGFGTNPLATGVYVGDGTLNWAKKLDITRPSGPGPYVSGSSGSKKAFTSGNGTTVDYFGNSFDRQGNFVARRPQVPEMIGCTVFKTTKALLDADLSYAAGTTAAVYADTAANNAIYTKVGTSGSGSWSKGILLLTDAQRPIYVVEQHGGGSGNISYQALFKSTNGGASFSLVNTLAIGTYATGDKGIYRIAVAPNGDVMLTGARGLHLSTDGGASFTSKYSRAVSDAHFFGGDSSAVSGARVGDDSPNSSGGVYAAANVRTSGFAKPASGGVANKGLPANFNVWELSCGAPQQPNWLLTNTNDHSTAYRSTDGGASWGSVTSAPTTGDENWRYDFRGKPAQGHSGWLFCPTNANRVVGFTFQTVTQSLDGGRTFQGNRSMFFDGMHHRGVGTGPMTGATPWKKLISVSQDSVVSTWLDGLNWMQRCGTGTGDPAFKTALTNAGAGSKPYVSGAAALLLANNRAISCVHRDQPAQSNVMVVMHERQSDGSYPNLLIRDLGGKKTRGHRSAWSLKEPGAQAFIGRWGISNVTAAPGSITFTDHSGHEYIDQYLDGTTLVTYWSDTPSGDENGANIYISEADDGVAGHGTAWHTPTGGFYYKAICIDPHTPERVLYVSNSDKSVIREVKRVGGALQNSTLKLAGGAAVDLRPMIEADFASRIPGGATLPSDTFADISQLVADPNMEGLFYAIVGVQGIPNLWMTVDNGLHWTNAADNLPRSLWFGWVHPLTGDLILDSSLGRQIKPPPAGYPSIAYKGALSSQLATFYANSTLPPEF